MSPRGRNPSPCVVAFLIVYDTCVDDRARPPAGGRGVAGGVTTESYQFGSRNSVRAAREPPADVDRPAQRARPPRSRRRRSVLTDVVTVGRARRPPSPHAASLRADHGDADAAGGRLERQLRARRSRALERVGRPAQHGLLPHRVGAVAVTLNCIVRVPASAKSDAATTSVPARTSCVAAARSGPAAPP